MAGPGWLMFSNITGQLALAGLCSVVLLDGCPMLLLVFSSNTGRLAQAGLCSGVLLYGWPRLHTLHLSWKLRDSPGFALTKSDLQRISRSLLFVPKMIHLSQLH